MGMAASQARLLSITSRMADNELRAQIINNSKMRLATDSSRVSEQYIDALNSATMMITNYDQEGNSQFQKLSFNSLTAYSPYNNQYGLVNSNGQLLVSEKEAGIFAANKNNLDGYLEAHGLTYSTTYFDNLAKTDYKEIFEELGLDYGIEELKTMYVGGFYNGTNSNDFLFEHLGYDESLNSLQYSNFTDFYNSYVLADDNYDLQVYDIMRDDVFGKNWKNGSTGIYDLYATNVNFRTMSELQQGISALSAKIQNLGSLGKISQNDEFYEFLMNIFNNMKFTDQALTYTMDLDVKYADGNKKATIADQSGKEINIEKEIQEGGSVHYVVKTPTSEEFEGEDENGNVINGLYNYLSSTSDFTTAAINFDFIIEEREGDVTTEDYRANYAFNWGDKKVACTQSLNLESAKFFVAQLYRTVAGTLIEEMNRDWYKEHTESLSAADIKSIQDAAEEYNKHKEQLLNFIFKDHDSTTTKDGEPININELSNMDYIFTNFSDSQLTEDMKVIKDIYILDMLFDNYGEPKYGWIDEAGGNADAKVKWYTNMFNRMSEGGYKALENGLASSNEWIEFALESGLVTMEQVDQSANWKSTVYSNCSSITEVTDDVAVAKAEAEYKKAMNNIENKDKRFDMELKNIDTEHNSLQTEYDSVKNVINKNIERSFKIYS